MNIVVCVKQVPDTWSERTLRESDSTLDRDAADAVINELDEFAIEEGLRLAEAHSGEVTILSMGPERATESIRKALSMGADKAVHLVDDALAGSDVLATSAALAAVLSQIGFDLVILGSESTDARTGVIPAMLSERLGVPQLSFASKVQIDGNSITINRLADYGYDTVEANQKLGYEMDLREYGLGAQILADLGLKTIRLLTNNPRKVVGLEGYGLEIVEQVPIRVKPNPHNARYLETKRKKLGHLL